MRRNEFNEYIATAQFEEFFNGLGWDKTGNQFNTSINIDENDFELKAIAQKRGFIIYTCEVESIPQNAFCRKLDIRLRRYSYDYILIFKEKDTEHHLWIAPIKTVEKRDLVTIEYTNASQADFLFSKLDSLSFDIDEEVTIVDVTTRIQSAFEVNSSKITKDFYSGFKKQHNSFMKFIQGIQIDGDKQWYASVMLNRLMFCYFIQKKGFLNFDVDYLRNKLKWTQDKRGNDQFFGSFYKGFLCMLFHGGLNNPKHDKDFEENYGRIPYLNGGLFDEHSLEKLYNNIDIADGAFEDLFAFFDKWHWHLDTRITASGKDINPDVLGYIFEQYINDRAQMGAYYTKEDITEYIGKNCIIPFLMDRVAKSPSKKHFEPTAYIWQMVKNSGDKYIYNAVKKGQGLSFPKEIEKGISPSKPNLMERRLEWNTPTTEDFALPTEIWRETVERWQRCAELKDKIKSGGITHINDFITYNLDIRSFVHDLLSNTTDHLLVKHFYKELQQITILDPTCGSGAFLFAALNILEPIYEVCIFRMKEFAEENSKLFKEELDEIESKYRSNIQYFIYKSIILRNLYGVDMMVEATEIAKLRLFLKMVAVVDVDKRADNLGLDPLPDIDFNIRCGNTLVGYATEKELDKELTYGDIFANQEFKAKVEDGMKKVAMTYDHFKDIQFTQHDDIEPFKKAKESLSNRLAELNTALNKRLYTATITSKEYTYKDWLKDYQPFHWLAEFYQIVKDNGGFDVIIGNPPYIEYSKIRKKYTLDNYETLSSGNLYGVISERATKLIHNNSFLGMIVPISIVCTQRMQSVQDILFKNQQVWLSNYAERPSKLFTGAEVLLSIYIINYSSLTKNKFATGFTKWKSNEREILFQKTSYTPITINPKEYIEPKITNKLEDRILRKMMSNNVLGLYFMTSKNNSIYYRIGGGRYWKIFTDFSPKFILNGNHSVSSRESNLFFMTKSIKDSVISVLSSSLFYWYFILTTNCRDLNPSDLKEFPYYSENNCIVDNLASLSHELMKDYKRNSLMKDKKSIKTGDIIYQEFYPRLSKSIIDEIDKILAQHYGFTDEELDFIINYDIKYRMGNELNNGEED